MEEVKLLISTISSIQYDLHCAQADLEYKAIVYTQWTQLKEVLCIVEPNMKSIIGYITVNVNLALQYLKDW